MSNLYNITNSKILITGGAGFIGTTLASKLVEDNEMVLFDNLHNNALENSLLKNHKNVQFIEGDILDREKMNSDIPKDIDYCIHCAAIAGVNTVMSNPLKTLNVNINGVFNIFELAEKFKNLKRIVDFSTSEVFGSRAYNVDEFTINPTVTTGEARWTYSISKLAGEFIAHAYHEQFDLPTVTVRPFNIYGPNQVGVGAIHHFVKHAINNKNLTIHDDGSQIRSWCYVDDFVHGVLLSLANEKAIGKSYNIGNPRSTITVYNLARMIIDLADSDSKLEFKKMNFQDVELRIPNIDSARKDLEYEPNVELEIGLKKTIDWYKSYT